MNAIKASLFILFLAFFIPALLSADDTNQSTDKTIAVMDLEPIGVTKDIADGVSEILRTEFVEVKKYRVIERSMLGKIIEEQKLSLTGLLDEKTAIQVGQLAGASEILVGSVVKTGSTYTINARLISVETAVSLDSQVVRGNSEDALSSMCKELVKGFVSGTKDIDVGVTNASVSNAAPNTNMTVVVLDVDVKGDVDVKEARKSLANHLSDSLAKTGKFNLYDRKDFNQVMYEQKLYVTEAFNQNAAVKLGKLTGVKAVVIGSMIEWGNAYTFTARLIDVATGKTLSDGRVGFKNKEDMAKSVDALAKKLVGTNAMTRSRNLGSVIFAKKKEAGRMEIFLNVGAGDGVAVGDEYEIYEPRYLVSDVTRERALDKEILIGRMVVEKISPYSSTGELTLNRPESADFAQQLRDDGIARIWMPRPFHWEITFGPEFYQYLGQNVPSSEYLVKLRLGGIGYMNPRFYGGLGVVCGMNPQFQDWQAYTSRENQYDIGIYLKLGGYLTGANGKEFSTGWELANEDEFMNGTCNQGQGFFRSHLSGSLWADWNGLVLKVSGLYGIAYTLSQSFGTYYAPEVSIGVRF
jgi:curli biogenesis system outer membrane secretion channel CsgG